MLDLDGIVAMNKDPEKYGLKPLPSRPRTRWRRVKNILLQTDITLRLRSARQEKVMVAYVYKVTGKPGKPKTVQVVRWSPPKPPRKKIDKRRTQ